MNLIEFIAYLRNNEKVVQYLNQTYPDIEYYNAEVYLRNSVNIESELVIFDDEKIEGLIEMHVNNEKYYNLFSLDLLIEVFEDCSALSPSGKDYEIAERIMNYRINDA